MNSCDRCDSTIGHQGAGMPPNVDFLHRRRLNQTTAEVKTEDLTGGGGVNETCLHDIEEDFLSQAVLAFEELVLGVGAGDVPADQLLTGGRHLQQLRVLVLHWHVSGVAQQLPDDGPEMMGNAFSDQLLDNGQLRHQYFVFLCCCCCCCCATIENVNNW